MSDAVDLYYAFSDDDTKLVKLVEMHLKVLQRDGVIKDSWSRRRIIAGKDKEGQIDEHLKSAKIILLLISPAFVAADDLFDGEMKRAFDRHACGEVRVILIRLREFKLPQLLLKSKSEIFPPIDKPALAAPKQKDGVFNDFAECIRKAVDELQGERSESAPTPETPLLPSPDFVAYLCDRREQKEQLKEALELQKAKIEKKNRLVPLICFIHGEVNESLEGFKQRLRANDIYELLELDRNEYPVKLVNLTWPVSYSERSNPQAHFERDLAKIVSSGPPVSKQDVLKVLGRHPGPIMLCYDFSTENWHANTPSIIEAFLEFWSDVAEIISTTPIIVCVLFEYEGADSEVFEQRNAEASAFFAERAETLSARFSVNSNACGVVLDRLRPVSRDDVNKWIDDSRAFAEFCLRHRPSFCHPSEIAKMKDAIIQMYDKVPAKDGAKRIPMRHLVPSLGKMLREYRCRT